MYFLQNTERPRPTIEMEHLRSKTREKEKRKVLKGREEIEDLSTFFNQYRKPLQEVSNNPGRELATEKPHARVGPPESIRQEPQFLYARQIDNSPIRRPQAPSLVSAEKYTDSASRVSGKATTYISWSETKFSPVKRRQKNTDHRRSLSPIPAAIQRSIEKTGIYRDTGIEMRQQPPDFTRNHTTTRLPRTETSRRSPKNRKRNRHHVGDLRGFRPEAITATTSTSNDEARSSPPRHNTNQHKNRRPRKYINENAEAEAKAFEIRNSNTTETSSNRPTTSTESRGNPVVEHFDRELGWHQSGNPQNNHQQTSESLTNSAIPETPLLDRAQLAKNAKVKRPSTTLPIVSTTATGVFSEEQNVRPATTEPSTTGVTSQLPQSAQLSEQPSVPVHESTQENNQGNSMQPALGLQHSASVQPVPVESRAEDIVVPMQGPTPQSLAASLHQSRGSSSTIRNNQEISTLRFNTPNLLGGLPLRGGLVHQFDPESRMSAPSSQGPLFIRQAQQQDPNPQYAIPGLARADIVNSMNFFSPKVTVPPIAYSHRPTYMEPPSTGNLGMETHEDMLYPEERVYDCMHYDPGDEPIVDGCHAGYAQESLLDDEGYTNNPPLEMEYSNDQMTADWYEGGQYQQQDNGQAYYDGRLLEREAFTEKFYPEWKCPGEFCVRRRIESANGFSKW